jgi:uncharacterized protein (DUF697 family)
MSTLTENPRENLVATPCQPITTHASPKDQTHYQSPEDNTTIADSEAKIPLPDLEKIESRVIRASQAHQLVKRYALNSLATGFIPLPLIDMAALFGIQLKMLYDLAKQYEVPFSHNIANSLISAMLGGFIPTTTATPIAASLSKSLPLFGQVSGMISMAAIGGASTYAVGKIFIEHFESGGTFLDFNPNKMREHFRELYEEGKQLVSKQQPQKN